MKFTCVARELGKKGALSQARRAGNIPAILYGPGLEGVPLYVKKEEFEAILRDMKGNPLSTVVFDLDGMGKKYKAIVKDIQRHRTSYAVEHIDFVVVQENTPITVNVPIQLAGVADCVGVKLGGTIRHAIRFLKVSCMPKEIPTHFALDIKDLQVSQSKRLSDIALPKGVKPLAKMNEVAVVVAKKV